MGFEPKDHVKLKVNYKKQYSQKRYPKGKKGRITSINGPRATVDFGGGDTLSVLLKDLEDA